MLTAIKAYENIRKTHCCDIWQYLKKFYYPASDMSILIVKCDHMLATPLPYLDNITSISRK